MIHRLLIKNYALIDHLDMAFDDGLTIITGETGAGKSILLGALGMILGNRADTKVLYNEGEKCVIEGYFDVSSYDLKDFFEENEVDYDVNTVVRRELTPSGKTRSFINDTPVNLNQLRNFTGKLVDLHQQFDTMEISDPSFQLQMIDALAGNLDVGRLTFDIGNTNSPTSNVQRPTSLLADYKKLFSGYQSNKRQLSDMVGKSVRSGKEIEFWKFQLNELEQAALVEGEQEQFENNLTRLQNGENIKRQLTAAYRAIIDDENAIFGQLRAVTQGVSQVKKFNPEIAQQYQRLESMMLELDDIGNELDRLSEDTEYNPEQIQTFQARLDVIYKLQKKHEAHTVADLLTIQNEFQAQLDAVSDMSENIEALKKQIAEQETALMAQAENLSQRRQSVALDFSEKILQRLRLLGMEQSQMSITFKPAPALTNNGSDEVQFLFAANRGSRLQPIKDVASGGELSRLALCAKSLVAAAIPLPTMIFDEIDSGVSGDIALKMGNILQQLAAHHQIVVITHSPQVAAKANKHYFVYKKLEENRTLTQVRLLDRDQRVKAIATMLSQNPPSASALENARELMNEKIPII